jgi:hypothetical protein
MSNYTKSTNFATKDALTSGNPLKIVKGTEIDTEFNNIQTAIATKADSGGITAVASGGTGATTASGARANLLPTYATNAGKVLAVNSSASDVEYITVSGGGGGSVTSVSGTGTVSGLSLSGTVTTSGSLTLSGTVNVSSPTGIVPTANGGTGTSATAYCSLISNVSGTLPVANGGTGSTSTAYCSLTSNVSGTLPIANGGTGATTLAGAGIPTLTGNNAFTQSSFGNTTSAGSTQALVVRPNASGGGSTVGLLTKNNGSSTGMVIQTDDTATRLSSYNYLGTEVGYITTNGSTCALNNFSDYRLKENVVSFAGAATKVKQLKPKTFTWINNPTIGVAEGFLAHELQEVVPNAVHGAKDAVDANNQPVYQGVDTTALIPLLTAALQEALTRIEALEVRITALESK